jgi:hypothetical protein
MKIDQITEQFIADTLERESRRFIATVLYELESHFGKDKRISDIVKNSTNTAKRVMFTQITKTEVEPRYANASSSQQRPG